MQKIAGAILAGGSSERFGEDKAAYMHQGQTFLSIMKSILEKSGLGSPYISHVDHVPDIHEGFGPIGGIHAILSRLGNRYDSVIFVPVDMPRLTPKLLKELIEAPEDTHLVFFEQHKFPLRLSCHDSVLEQLEQLLTERINLSLGYLFDHIENQSALLLDEVDALTLANINTPADLACLD